MTHRFSPLMVESLATKRKLFDFIHRNFRQMQPGQSTVADFVWGNPQEMSLPGLVDAIRKNAAPKHHNWYAYMTGYPEGQSVIAENLEKFSGLPYEGDDIVLTSGSFGALSVMLRSLSGPGSEVVYMAPPWFNYASMIAAAGAKSVALKVRRDDFDLDLEAIASALNARTAVIIVNSPHNPTGKIYPPETLERLSQILTAASKKFGRMIYLISDESYNRIVFDGREFPTPAKFYPHTLVSYTYGKTLLAPGARLGYIAISPQMPEKPTLREMLLAAQLASGWAFPDNIMMYAIKDLESLSIDIAHLQSKRDRMVTALQSYGYELHVPEGTFYIVVRSPMEDEEAFCGELARHGVLVMPGGIFDLPGYFRISLTASDEMIDRGLPGFKAAMEETRKRRVG